MPETQRNELILADLIALRAEQKPDLDVLTFVSVAPDGSLRDEVRTYADLWRNGNRIAAGLAAEGCIDGAPFAIMMRNHPAFVEAMVGASVAGAVFVPIDPRAQDDKLVFMLKHTECQGVLVGDYALDSVLAVRDKVPSLKWIWVLRTGQPRALPAGVRAVDEVLASGLPDIACRVTDPNQAQQLLFTSGTTGDPKAIVAAFSRMGSAAGTAATFGLRPNDRPYTGLSLTHANAQMLTVATSLHAGLRAVVSERFTKSRLLDIARKYGCTVFTVLGGMATAIYSEPRKPDDADTPFRMVISAGMPAAIWRQFEERFGVQVYEFYGAAEGGLCVNPPGVGPIGSVGRPPPHMILKIFCEDGRECAPGEAGEICFRSAEGAAVNVDYLKNPKASGEKVAGGWLRMGDIGHVDKNGWLFFHYRKGGQLRRNGEFIDPARIEKVLAEHPEVADVFVYGVPAASGAPGEKDVVAAVVPADAKRFDPAALYAYCRVNIEPNSLPVVLQIVDQITKTASEKPQERFLAADLAAGVGRLYRARDLQPSRVAQ
jgi:crotonobetaine/carnitine-CoA ligase